MSRLRILEVVLRETRAITGADRLGLATILSFELSDGRSAPAERCTAASGDGGHKALCPPSLHTKCPGGK